MIGTTLNGRFRLEERLGSGGMSTVYRAFDETLERWVAIKIMHSEISGEEGQLERFRREARAVARVSSPHVVTVIDAGEDDAHPYIVFECVDGETLKDRIRRLGPLPIAEAAAYAIEIGRALSAAHAERLVHRDVKPQNVLLNTAGRAKVTDFGIARSLEVEGLTMDGRVLGTTDYISPEQALGQEVSPQSDIYSLGVVLYEMLTGDLPFKADTQVAVAMKHVREPLPDVQTIRPEVSSALAAIVDRATAKELGNRFATADEIVHDLEQALGIEAARAGAITGEATSVLRTLPSDTSDFAPVRLRDPRRWLVSVLLLGAIAAAVVIVVATQGERGTRGGAEPSAPAGGLQAVTLSLANDYDPAGDDEEHGRDARIAIDDNRGTGWTTEGYEGGQLGKPGVGLWVRTRDPVAARRLSLVSQDPGWQAEVYGAGAELPKEIGGWTRVAERTTVGETKRIPLDTAGRRYERYLVWIVGLPRGKTRASINELTLSR